ncbi:cytochrome P450 [Pseudomonas sp. PA27(2017)]|uniref:cytochrome P450 n=1 Tax=Pseudomonas sp. PA27(2017) TaxID=1932112 RepID=UPI00095E9F62|nr:cytochrome P450 [Pseudomonas sp. PA27(2017)]OLU33794.1 cytochrome [Pseudomonas sp. PA27(2017)]
MNQQCPVAYPFNRFTTLDLAGPYKAALAQPGLLRIQMPFGTPAWLATRNEEVRLVLAERRFSRAEAFRHEDSPRAFSRIAGGIVTMDPPHLNRLRSVAAQAFTRRRVEALRPAVRAHALRLIEAMQQAGRSADLVEAFALPLPIALICELLGVPEQDHNLFKAWSDLLLSTENLEPHVLQGAQRDMASYIMGLISARRETPRDDFMTALVQAHEQGERLSEQELILLCMAILIAGYEGSASQIPNFVMVLQQHRDQWLQLTEQPELIPGAVEELLRFIPLASAAMFVHYAQEDIQVGQTLVRKGEPVFASIGAANHDPSAFNEPQRLDLKRDAQGHVAFGHGLHHCIGAALARVELQEALTALTRYLPDLRLGSRLEWKQSTFFRGATYMEVTW